MIILHILGLIVDTLFDILDVVGKIIEWVMFGICTACILSAFGCVVFIIGSAAIQSAGV